MKKIPKILTIIFLTIFILQLASLIFLLILPNNTQAAEPLKFTPQISIGEFQAGIGKAIGENSIGEYIREIYSYAIGIVGILAAVVLMWGGLNWLTAGGDQGRITEAKAWIGASLTGLIIALSSYLILFTINPDLINFKPIKVATVKEAAKSDSQEEKLKEKLFCIVNNKCQGDTSVSTCQLIGGTSCANGCTDGKCDAGQTISLCNGKRGGTCIESSKPFCVVIGKYGTDPLYGCSSDNVPQYCDNLFSCPYNYSCNEGSSKCEKNSELSCAGESFGTSCGTNKACNKNGECVACEADIEDYCQATPCCSGLVCENRGLDFFDHCYSP